MKTDHRIVVLGAGSAAIGVADMISTALVDEGLTQQQAADRFWFVDIDGLLVRSRSELTPEQRIYARDDTEVRHWGAGAQAAGVARVEGAQFRQGGRDRGEWDGRHGTSL
ncbi:malic enzyme-like NAD(P)-binding protein [Streptomyces sp. NPDC001268]|uniref:malic enzyme-like NAD(P)-binding protein n=1 Tax=Streptomyces TaxID=1883 RepID=UPI00369E238F